MKKICLLGASGSIGQSTLDLIKLHAQQFCLHAISVWSNLEKAWSIIQEHQPLYVVVQHAADADILHLRFKQAQLQGVFSGDYHPTIMYGNAALDDIAAHADVDIVVAAIVGSAGISSTFAAIQAGKRVLLANKEVLVAAGHLVKAYAHPQTEILPVDSEHNAIWQCYEKRDYVANICLTASGGPFLHTPNAQLENITPAQACAHPTWAMGRKISVDSATMMNKGLEVIEAHHLFDAMPAENIRVQIHPQSIIHSMVEYIDGSILAQLSNPDMRIPILYALAYPQRLDYAAKPMQWQHLHLDFMDVDIAKYPCLSLAYAALKAEQGNVLNAANEVAVEAFLQERIGFLEIAQVVEQTLSAYQPPLAHTLEDVFAVDQEARRHAKAVL